MPATATESFAGVGYPFSADIIRYFAGSASESTRRAAHGLGAHAIVLRGGKR